MSVKRKIVNEIHRPARVRFERRKVILKGIRDLYQCDLVEMIPYAQFNNNYKYILFTIDCFTKMAYGEPLKTKQGSEVAAAMNKILQRAGIPRLMQSDFGGEFYSPDFKKLMQMHNIKHYSTYSVIKGNFIERLNKTLKGKIYKEFSFNGNYKWVSILQNILNDYNNSKHRTIAMKPSDVNPNNEKILLRTVYSYRYKQKYKIKFNEGDFVRISKYRHIFAKGYHPQWTTEVFVVRKVQQTKPVTYLLSDMSGDPIEGSFYPQELQKTNIIHHYLVERVIKTKGNKLFVKWLGFKDSHNSWINKNDVL